MFLFPNISGHSVLTYGYFVNSKTLSCTKCHSLGRSVLYRDGWFITPVPVAYQMSPHQAEMYIYWITLLDSRRWSYYANNITRVGLCVITSGSILYDSTYVEPCEPFVLCHNGTTAEAWIRNGEMTISLPRLVAASLAINGAHLEY